MSSSLVLFLELKESTETDCSVTPAPHKHEYICTLAAACAGKELGVPMYFGGPSIFPACQGNNSRAGDLGPRSEAALGHAPEEQFIEDFVLSVDTALLPLLITRALKLSKEEGGWKQRIYSGTARRVAAFGVGGSRYLELNQDSLSQIQTQLGKGAFSA